MDFKYSVLNFSCRAEVHQPDASEDEPVGRNNDGPGEDTSVELPILKGIFKEILFGSYKSATYVNAASFLK